MGEFDEEGEAVAAANILLSLRKRRLRGWPEWVPRPSEEETAAEAAAVELPPLPQRWPKRPRSPLHVGAKEKSKAVAAWNSAARYLLASLDYSHFAGSGASSSGEDGARSPPLAREKPEVKAEPMAALRPETALYYGAAVGSGPSTSGLDRARAQPLRSGAASEKAWAKGAAARKDTMAAPSPETPLDYAAAAGSGASSSGDDGARSLAKSPGAGGSGDASSGDEGCSSPAERTRADAAASDGAGQPTAAAVEVEELKVESEVSQNRDENGLFLFDLNEVINDSWEG